MSGRTSFGDIRPPGLCCAVPALPRQPRNGNPRKEIHQIATPIKLMVPRPHDHGGTAKLVAERFDRLVGLMGVVKDVVLDRDHCEGDALFFNQGYIIA